jgi:hypothetical protein
VSVDPSPQRRKLRRAEAAQFVRDAYGVPLSASTLAKLAVVGGGPPYVKISRYPVYDVDDLRAWIEARTSAKLRSTSEEAA